MSDRYSTERRRQFLDAMLAELDHAYAKHGADPWGRHEFYAVLKEEVDEIWDAIKSDAPMEEVLKEVMQVAAVCLRYAETPDRYRGPHPLPLPSRAICVRKEQSEGNHYIGKTLADLAKGGTDGR